MPQVIGIAGPLACRSRTCRARPSSSDNSSTSSSQRSSRTGVVIRSSHAIRARPTASRIKTAATPLSQTGKMSVGQFGVIRQRTLPTSVVVAGGVGLGVRATAVEGAALDVAVGAGVTSRPRCCGISFRSKATGTSSRGQPATRQFGSNAEARGSTTTAPQARVQTR